jgi:hypothetical protein
MRYKDTMCLRAPRDDPKRLNRKLDCRPYMPCVRSPTPKGSVSLLPLGYEPSHLFSFPFINRHSCFSKKKGYGTISWPGILYPFKNTTLRNVMSLHESRELSECVHSHLMFFFRPLLFPKTTKPRTYEVLLSCASQNTHQPLICLHASLSPLVQRPPRDEVWSLLILILSPTLKSRY